MLLVSLQQIGGMLIVLLILLDVFLTVLYARMGSWLLSPRLARTAWRAFRGLARGFPRFCGRIASFCGPIILVLLVFGCASFSASRRSVLTRSPVFVGTSVGATTSHCTPSSANCQYTT